MKSLATFLNESFQLDRKAGQKNTGKRSKDDEMSNANASNFKFFKNRGWELDPSVHAASQAKDRRPELSEDDWKKLHRNVVAALPRKIKSGEYLFYSKSMEQGYVASVNAQKKRIRIITVLPKKRSNAAPGTDRMVVECEDYGVEQFFLDGIIEVE